MNVLKFLKTCVLDMIPMWGNFRARCKGVQVGARCKVQGVPFVRMKRGSTITVGEGTTLCSLRWFNPSVTSRCALYTMTPEAQIRIGAHCAFSGVTMCCSKEITVGAYTLMGAGTLILDRMGHSYTQERGWNNPPGTTASRPVRIGEKCFIGARCMIFAGATIGDRCVIAAGCVVTGDVPSGYRAYGNPMVCEPLPAALGGPEPQRSAQEPLPSACTMTPELQKLVALIEQTLGLQPGHLLPTTGPGDIPEWDSLSHMAVVAAVTETYGVNFTAEELLSANSVADFARLLQQHRSEPNCAPEHAGDAPQKERLEDDILNIARCTPAKAALIFPHETVSYGELVDGMRRAAAWLQKTGVQGGDVVLLSAERRKEFFFAYFGAHLIGAAVLNVDADTKAERLALLRAETHPVLSFGLPAGENAHAYEELLSGTLLAELPSVCPQSTADIMFTTGTTGVPKGVPLTHANLAAAAHQINTFIGTNADDTEVLALPICHSFGMGRARCVLSRGGTLVVVNGFSNPRRLFEALEKHRATGFAFVPAAWAYLTQMSGDAIASHAQGLRYIEIGSAPMAETERRRLMRLFPKTRLCMHYGLTEASRSAFIEFHSESAHLQTAGRPSPGVEIRICSSEGYPLPPGEEGEICIKGAHVISGYLRPQASPTHFGAFFRTGDWGMMDEDGYLHVMSRTKDMINVGGKKVAPDELEQLLVQLPGVAEAACVPAPDPKGVLGEVVKAVLVRDAACETRPTEEEVRAYIAARTEHYKVPSFIEWRESLPRTASGKLQRNKV